MICENENGCDKRECCYHAKQHVENSTCKSGCQYLGGSCVNGSELDTAVICCGKDMLQIGNYLHCKTCQRRLRDYPCGKELAVLAELLVSYVQEFDPSWKDLQRILHELWKAGHYEDYESNLPWMEETKL